MTTEEYRRALDAAIAEYESLGAERQKIDKRLTDLAQTISTLSRLCGLTPTVPWGLTDACRIVLRSGRPMSATDVRDRLLGIGFDLSKYSVPLAAIHTVLKRLNEAGEARFLAGGPNRGAYLWEQPVNVAKLGPEIAEVVRRRAKPTATTGKKRPRSER
ncbi:MAG TPA: hypothetical protein VH740_03055 [Vicinamibacterales bacterium]|jgi:hypothetical protein